MDTSESFNYLDYRQHGKLDLTNLQQEAPAPPRYLIRVHSQASQGLMTSNSFVSAAELHASELEESPPSLDTYPAGKFEHHVHNHLTNFKGNALEPFESPFISLTVSLRTALAWAKMRSLWKHSGVRIAVIDTTTITHSNCDCGQYCDNPFHQNPIWPANIVYKACRGKDKDYPDEFLAFGHVRGSFKICTFAELETTFLNQYFPELSFLSRGQRYEELPSRLESLWRSEQRVHKQEMEIAIYIAQQLSNDNLLIPMVAFVLCVKRRSLDDKRLLDIVVKAARLVEQQATYDFLGYFDAFPVLDYFFKKQCQQIITADSVELVQTSAILDRVKLRFAETQENKARLQ